MHIQVVVYIPRKTSDCRSLVGCEQLGYTAWTHRHIFYRMCIRWDSICHRCWKGFLPSQPRCWTKGFYLTKKNQLFVVLQPQGILCICECSIMLTGHKSQNNSNSFCFWVHLYDTCKILMIHSWYTRCTYVTYVCVCVDLPPRLCLSCNSVIQAQTVLTYVVSLNLWDAVADHWAQYRRSHVKLSPLWDDSCFDDAWRPKQHPKRWWFLAAMSGLRRLNTSCAELFDFQWRYFVVESKKRCLTIRTTHLHVIYSFWINVVIISTITGSYPNEP